MFDGLTGKERYYYEEVLRIGREKGDCQELQDIYRQVLADRVAGNISEEAYRMVYGLCIELAYQKKKKKGNAGSRKHIDFQRFEHCRIKSDKILPN